jgi:hypothetical protein
MVSLVSLWLPVLVASLVVFLLSSVLHMLFRYHNTDFNKLPDEDGIAAALRKFSVPPGEYMIPYAADGKERMSPEFLAKLKNGPVARITMWPTRDKLSMGPELLQWFIYCVVVSIFAAYVTGRAVQAGAEYLHVFRFAGTTAFFCYTVAGWQASIWWKQPWSTTVKNTFDGLLYGLFTAGVFGWLWPR